MSEYTMIEIRLIALEGRIFDDIEDLYEEIRDIFEDEHIQIINDSRWRYLRIDDTYTLYYRKSEDDFRSIEVEDLAF